MPGGHHRLLHMPGFPLLVEFDQLEFHTQGDFSVDGLAVSTHCLVLSGTLVEKSYGIEKRYLSLQACIDYYKSCSSRPITLRLESACFHHS